jgi:hypothetical protein
LYAETFSFIAEKMQRQCSNVVSGQTFFGGCARRDESANEGSGDDNPVADGLHQTTSSKGRIPARSPVVMPGAAAGTHVIARLGISQQNIACKHRKRVVARE